MTAKKSSTVSGKYVAAAYQLFQGHIDQIGQVVFGSRGFDHRTKKYFLSGWIAGRNLQRFPDEGQVSPARSGVVVAYQVVRREQESGPGGNVVDNRGRNLVLRHGIPQTLEDLEVDEKAKRGDWAFGGAVSQEEFSGCRGIDLVEFFGCERAFQARIGSVLNGCHENYSVAASSVYFHVLMWYIAANIP